MAYLNCLSPSVEPRVSDHMPQIIDMIKQVFYPSFELCLGELEQRYNRFLFGYFVCLSYPFQREYSRSVIEVPQVLNM